MSDDHPHVAFFPPLGAATAMALTFVSSKVMPLDQYEGLPPPLILVLGALLFGTGFALGLWALLSFHWGGTNVEPHKPTLAIVSDGPYRVNRNPMYTALLLCTFGIGLVAFDVWWSCVWTAVLAVALHFGVVLREEAYLDEKFGDEYRALLSRTRRWL